MKSQSLRPSSAAKRDAIIDAAARVFVRDGYDPASVDDIAALAGVSKPTVYAHFASKANLFIRVVEHETARAFDQLRIGDLAAGKSTADLSELLRRLGETLLDVILEPRIVGLRRLAIAESHRFPEPAAAFAQGGYERSVAALTAFFADADISGDARWAATVFLQLAVVGPTDRAMFGVPLAAEHRAQHVATAVETFLAAFRQ